MTPMGMMGYPMQPAYPQGNAMLNAGLMNPGLGRRRPQGIQQKLRQQQNAQMLRMNNMQGMNAGLGLTRGQRRAMNRQLAAMQLQQQMMAGQQRGQQRMLGQAIRQGQSVPVMPTNNQQRGNQMANMRQNNNQQMQMPLGTSRNAQRRQRQQNAYRLGGAAVANRIRRGGNANQNSPQQVRPSNSIKWKEISYSFQELSEFRSLVVTITERPN